jgi:hypothetical protein
MWTGLCDVTGRIITKPACEPEGLLTQLQRAHSVSNALSDGLAQFRVPDEDYRFAPAREVLDYAGNEAGARPVIAPLPECDCMAPQCWHHVRPEVEKALRMS